MALLEMPRLTILCATSLLNLPNLMFPATKGASGAFSAPALATYPQTVERALLRALADGRDEGVPVIMMQLHHVIDAFATNVDIRWVSVIYICRVPTFRLRVSHALPEGTGPMCADGARVTHQQRGVAGGLLAGLSY